MICNVRVLNLGLKSYGESLKIQNYVASLLKSGKVEKLAGIIILVEHNPVFTVGIRTKDYAIKDEEKLISLGAEFFKTNRGGLITFHGPGQMVAYPILNLKMFKPSIQWYVSALEKTIIDLCCLFDLQGNTSPHTGVWIKDKKICAIGIHGSRYITTHGLALNCNMDLFWFDHIVPCGIKDKGVTSFSKELGRDVTVGEVHPSFLKCFERIFKCSLIPMSGNETTNLLSEVVKGSNYQR